MEFHHVFRHVEAGLLTPWHVVFKIAMQVLLFPCPVVLSNIFRIQKLIVSDGVIFCKLGQFHLP